MHREPVQVQELESAALVVQSFITVFKSFSLYPEDHVFCRTNLEKFFSALQAFLDEFDVFSLDIEKNTFLYAKEKIFEGSQEEGNPAYLLNRDGLVRLDFMPGIQAEEISGLLKILNQHRSAADESGGDIVSSLWLAEFPHIAYQEVDIFILEAFDFDLAALKASPDDASEAGLHDKAGQNQDGETVVEEEPKGELVKNENVTNLLRLDQPLRLFSLSREEKETLLAYIREDEQRDYTNDVIDILLIILISQKNKLHFNQVLEFIKAVFFETLNRGDFHLAHKLCSNILTIGDRLKSIRGWVLDAVDEFVDDLSAAENWQELSWVNNPHLLVILYGQFRSFLWQVVRLLGPDIIFTLGPLMARIDKEHVHVRNELYELIESKARIKPANLDRLLVESGEEVGMLLFPIVEKLGRIEAEKISLSMTRNDSAAVRLAGLNIYFTHASQPDFRALKHVLNDTDELVISKFLSFLLARAEMEEAEELLMDTLQQAVEDGRENPRIFEYYKALSQCGSERSVRLLKRILMDSSLKDMFSNVNALHKKGSALALRILGTEEALKVLRKGAKSMRPDIRLASRFAMEKVK